MTNIPTLSSGSTSTWTPCRWCGNVQHTGLCPRVKAIDYYPDGTIKHVTFFSQWAAPGKTKPIGIVLSEERDS